LIRVPGNRAGSSIRCSECKAVIKLPKVSESEAKSGKPIPIVAVAVSVEDKEADGFDSESQPAAGHDIATDKIEVPVQSESVSCNTSDGNNPLKETGNGLDSVEPNVEKDSSLEPAVINSSIDEIDTLTKTLEKNQPQNAKVSIPNVKDAKGSSKPLDHTKRAAALAKNNEHEESDFEPISELPMPSPSDSAKFSSDVTPPTEVPTSRARNRQPSDVEPLSFFQQLSRNDDIEAPKPFEELIDQNEGAHAVAPKIEIAKQDNKREKLEKSGSVKIELLESSPASLEQKVSDDHRIVARFYGLCIAILGVVSLAPAIVFLVKLNQAGMNEVTPRWIFLLIFVGAMHLIYSVYLMQISDWSALWAISILMLAASCLYGVFCGAILLDDGYGIVSRFLQISSSQQRSAMIWCLIGLTFSVLSSYLCGREAINWRRNEKFVSQYSSP